MYSHRRVDFREAAIVYDDVSAPAVVSVADEPPQRPRRLALIQPHVAQVLVLHPRTHLTRPLAVLEHEPRIFLALSRVCPRLARVVFIFAPQRRFRRRRGVPPKRLGVNPLRRRPLRPANHGAPGVHALRVDLVVRRDGIEEQTVALFRLHRDVVLRAVAPRTSSFAHRRVDPFAIRERRLAAFLDVREVQEDGHDAVAALGGELRAGFGVELAGRRGAASYFWPRPYLRICMSSPW